MTVDSYKWLPPSLKTYFREMAVPPPDGVPWTPLGKPLARVRIALVTTAGLNVRGLEPPFDYERERAEPMPGGRRRTAIWSWSRWTGSSPARSSSSPAGSRRPGGRSSWNYGSLEGQSIMKTFRRYRADVLPAIQQEMLRAVRESAGTESQ